MTIAPDPAPVATPHPGRALAERLLAAGYVPDETLAMALHLAVTLGRPLLLEGEAGVGKTAIAQALALALGTRLIRLQCYEGLDAGQALYEWNYQRQLLALKLLERQPDLSLEAAEAEIFGTRYLLRRPLLEAISQETAPVLLIDEIDRADEAFEAYLLELLAEFQISVPELGTITATTRPVVILTSNGTRTLSDALRRRCLYTWVPYPDPTREQQILARHLPDIDATLARQIVSFVQALRREDLEKTPGIAETLDWARALTGLDVRALAGNADLVQATLVCLLKTQADQGQVAPEVTRRLLDRVA